jgi:hypothetical protein
MRTTVGAGVLMAVAALCWARSTDGQVQSVPGPGSGIVTVQGEVDVRRLPPIDAGQRGDWKVSLANVPDVRVVNTPTVTAAPLAFLKAGGRYAVTWPAGDTQRIGVAELGSGGWVRAAGQGRQLWLNLATAKAIQEVP